MTLADLEWKTFGTVAAVLTLIVAVTGRNIEARPQAATPVPVVSNDPAVQRTIESSLTPARLDPRTRINLDLRDKPLTAIIDAVAKAGGISVSYAPAITSLDTSTTITVSDVTVEDALKAALQNGGLTFQVLRAETVFIYPDTPENREKYTESNRVFAIAKADPVTLARQLNQALRSPTEVFQPVILTVRDSRIIIVRAIPAIMARAATFISENDQE